MQKLRCPCTALPQASRISDSLPGRARGGGSNCLNFGHGFPFPMASMTYRGCPRVVHRASTRLSRFNVETSRLLKNVRRQGENPPPRRLLLKNRATRQILMAFKDLHALPDGCPHAVHNPVPVLCGQRRGRGRTPARAFRTASRQAKSCPKIEQHLIKRFCSRA